MNGILTKIMLLIFLITLISSINCIQPKKAHSLQTEKPNSISSLTISNPNSKSSLLSFKLKNTELLYSLGLLDNSFTLSSKDDEIIHIDSNKTATISSNTLLTNSLNLEGPLKYKDVSQWRMYSYDNFENNMTSLGWNISKTSECKSNYKMIGGFCQLSKESIVKRFNNLPKHSMIRVEALYHFIGNWDQHTGYLQARIDGSDKYLWSSRCKTDNNYEYTKEMCEYQVCKIGDVINVSFYHNEENLKLIFGSTLTGHPCDQSYGVSDIKIYIK